MPLRHRTLLTLLDGATVCYLYTTQLDSYCTLLLFTYLLTHLLNIAVDGRGYSL